MNDQHNDCTQTFHIRSLQTWVRHLLSRTCTCKLYASANTGSHSKMTSDRCLLQQSDRGCIYISLQGAGIAARPICPVCSLIGCLCVDDAGSADAFSAFDYNLPVHVANVSTGTTSRLDGA